MAADMVVGQVGVTPSSPADATRPRLLWLEYVKAFALIWIFLNHISEHLFGSPAFENPTQYWPLMADRISQLRPLEGFGSANAPVNLLRYVGWSGDQGVQLFLIVSGFGLTWGLLARYGKTALPLRSFYLRRMERIYPLWWACHIFFGILALLIPAFGITPVSFHFILSLLGIRVTPGQLYYFSGAWWYVPLLLQLYFVYPILWSLARRRGPLALLVFAGGGSLLIRGIGLFLLKDSGYLDAWSRGAIFVTRLPEFVVGVSLAVWLYQDYARIHRWLHRPSTLMGALMMYGVGFVLSFDLLGMTAAPFLLGVGMFILLYALFTRHTSLNETRSTIWVWLGEHSYSFYLIHSPFMFLFIPNALATDLLANGAVIANGVICTIVFTWISSIFLEWIADYGLQDRKSVV